MLPWRVLLSVCATVACSSSESASPAPGGGGTAAGGGSAGSAVADGGWAASSGAGGSGGTLPLPCDAGFAFTPDPPGTGSVLRVAVTHAQPLAYVDLKVSGSTSPSVVYKDISTTNPWTWNWDVVGLAPGLYVFELFADQPAKKFASCTRNVLDTGTPPSGGTGGGGTGGSGAAGGGGTGGSGGHCCSLVGTKLANPSPCGPSAQSSPWQTLDNAGCNAQGCNKIWCPFEKCDSAKYPNGCPQGTEACWISNTFSNYEAACKSCCESLGACWDAQLSTCRHPGDCGKPLWQCPWQ